MERGHLEATELERYVDGELRGEEASRAESHVQACETCRREVEERRRIGTMLAGALRAEVEQANLGRVWPGVRRAMAERREKEDWSLGDFIRALVRPQFAAAVAVAAVVAVLIVAGLRMWTPTPAMVAEVSDITAPEDPAITIAVERLAATGTTVVWINGLTVTEENGG